MNKDQMIKAEYETILKVWKIVHKWLEKIPMDIDDYNVMVAEMNEICKEYPKEDQMHVSRILNDYGNRIEELDKRLRGVK